MSGQVKLTSSGVAQCFACGVGAHDECSNEVWDYVADESADCNCFCVWAVRS